MKLISSISFLALAVLTIVAISCKKTGITIAPPQAHFVGDANQTYSILVDPAPAYNVVVGTTNVASADRKVSYTVTSPTGAVAGTHYTLGTPGTITIPAGQSTANIDVHGIYSAYATSGRKDTLIFTLTDPEVTPAEFQNTVKLLLRGPCFEGDVDLNAFLGDYDKTTETFGTSAYGPYTTSISSFTQLTPTSGTIKVENIFDFGWSPITFTLDWTDPANRTVTVVSQSGGIADAGTLDPSFAGEEVQVRPFAGQPGTFSACTGRLTLKMQLGVAGLGYFGSLYTVNMVR
jgi:hypothetical protein